MTEAPVTRLDELPLALTVPEYCRVLRAGKNTVYEMIRRGEIPHVRVGRSIRIPRAVVERLLQEVGG